MTEDHDTTSAPLPPEDEVSSGATDLLAELIRIPSVNPTAEGEGLVAERLRTFLDGAGLHTDILTSPAGRPSLVARIPGPTDVAPLVLLSHTDVVPVEEAAWRRDPFGGEVVDGELWGRGALDMKGVAVMHAMAAAALAGSGATPSREVIVAAVADEEAGGTEGAGWLMQDRPELLGFRDGMPPPDALGEGAYGLSGLLEPVLMPIVVGEKCPLTVRATATGAPGHGSMPPPDQAILGLARFVDEVTGHGAPRIHPVMRAQFRELAAATSGPLARIFALLAGAAGPTAVKALASVLRARAGVIGLLVADSVTPTKVDAGYAFNVVPGEADAWFDCRLLPDTDPEQVLAELAAIGVAHGVEVDAVHRWASPVSDPGHVYDVVREVSTGLAGSPVTVPSLTPGTTDLRYLRAAGARAYGWVPLVLSPGLLATFHGHDERIPIAGLSRAVDAMTEVVRRAAT
jgi:acetylornithine deacetylase/succinyl-diaminopimelate desuccinylase-like protein